MQIGKQHQAASMYTNKIEKVILRVVIETMNDLIVGDMHMRPRLRLIDELISGEPFLAVTNATVYDKSGKQRYSTRFLSINRDFVIFVSPWNDMEENPLLGHETSQAEPLIR